MKITCDAGLLHDAVADAAKVASNRPEIAGIELLVEASALEPTLVVRSTNLDSSFARSIPVETAESGRWRFAAPVLAGVVAGLRDRDKITLADSGKDDSTVHLKAGKAKARLRTMTEPLPEAAFPAVELNEEVPHLGELLARVAWAADTSDTVGPFGGVLIDGTRLVASDRSKVTIIACETPLSAPVVAPVSQVANLLRGTTDVALGLSEKVLSFSPDKGTTVLWSRLIDQAFPPIDKVLRDDFTVEATVDAKALASAIGRIAVLARGEKLPVVNLTFRPDDTIHLRMDVPEVGLMEDEFAAPCTADEPFEIHFTPLNLQGALQNAESSEALLRCGPGPRQSLSVQSGDYRCDVMPRAVVR